MAHTHTLTRMQRRFDDKVLTFRYAAANIIRCEHGEGIVKILMCLFVPPNLGFTTKNGKKKTVNNPHKKNNTDCQTRTANYESDLRPIRDSYAKNTFLRS